MLDYHPSDRISVIRQQVLKPYTAEDLINPYSPTVEFRNFPDLQHRMESYYDIIFDTAIEGKRYPIRYIYEMAKKIAFRDAFYYIDRLYDNNPTSVVDIGAGNCFWKNWFPGIVSVDSNVDNFIPADIIADVDDSWCQSNRKNYDVGINICGAQWNTQDNIVDWVESQMEVVKDRCLFAVGRRNASMGISLNRHFNLQHMIDQVYFLGRHYKILILDVPELRGIPPETMHKHAHINGCIRFLLAHS